MELCGTVKGVFGSNESLSAEEHDRIEPPDGSWPALVAAMRDDGLLSGGTDAGLR